MTLFHVPILLRVNKPHVYQLIPITKISLKQRFVFYFEQKTVL